MTSIINIKKNVVSALEDIKAFNIVSIDIRKQSSIADYIIIASANSSRQAKALAINIRGEMNKIKISLLHLAPSTGQLESNKALLLQSLKLCAQMKSDWVISPELWVCGYSFERMIGSDWITHQPDTWMQELCSNMPTWNFNLFLSMPEKDNSTNQLHNTVFVINREGSIIGNYRKIKVLPQFTV